MTDTSTLASPEPRVLFFAKHGCEYSQHAVQHLRILGFDLQVVLCRSRTEKIPHEVLTWSGSYIFCFRSYFKIPESLLAKASVAAINFHPGPVEYPGSGSINWALYDRSVTYGATAHVMNAEIDNGPIVECRRFPILEHDTVTTLLARAHVKTLDLLIDITTGLALEGKSFLDERIKASATEKWNGKARRISALDELQIVAPTCTKEELDRIVRSTHTSAFPVKMKLHEYTFVLTL